MQLHIFEPRYQQLFNELEQEDFEFGIPFSTGRIKHSLGSKCRLVEVLEVYDEGAKDVLVECTGVFNLKEYRSAKRDKLYPCGSVEMLKNINKIEVSEGVQREYSKYVESMRQSNLPFEHTAEKKLIPILRSLNFNSEEKFNFMKIRDGEQRQLALLNMIRFCRLIAEQELKRENGIYLS